MLCDFISGEDMSLSLFIATRLKDRVSLNRRFPLLATMAFPCATKSNWKRDYNVCMLQCIELTNPLKKATQHSNSRSLCTKKTL